jgi:hypothetical protein
MVEELPVVCSLGAGDLEARLAEIGAVGAESLIEHRREGAVHLLRFRADAGTHERLEGIVAAEAECCAFLDLKLKAGCCELVLSVAAPEAGRLTADGFAMAFGARDTASTGSETTRSRTRPSG